MIRNIETSSHAGLTLLSQPDEPPYPYLAALYWLDSGHYLFRLPKKTAAGIIWRAKFVSAQDVVSAFSGSEIDTGWLAPGVVRCGHSQAGPWYVYSAPPQKALIQLDDAAPRMEIPLPRTVMLAIGRGYYLWALMTKRFDPRADACHAPLPNIHSNGSVCWGQLNPPAVDARQARRAWELIVCSVFTDHLVDGKSRAQTNDIRLMLKQVQGRSTYPVDDLVPVGNISVLIDTLLKNE